MQDDIVIAGVQTVSCNLRIIVARMDEQTSLWCTHWCMVGYPCVFPQLSKSKVGNTLFDGVWID